MVGIIQDSANVPNAIHRIGLNIVLVIDGLAHQLHPRLRGGHLHARLPLNPGPASLRSQLLRRHASRCGQNRGLRPGLPTVTRHIDALNAATAAAPGCVSRSTQLAFKTIKRGWGSRKETHSRTVAFADNAGSGHVAADAALVKRSCNGRQNRNLHARWR